MTDEEERCQNGIWPKGNETPIRCELQIGHHGAHRAGDRAWTSESEKMTIERGPK